MRQVGDAMAKSISISDAIELRDLNRNGRIDPYEDPRRPVEDRVEDLLSQMTLAEKAGLMFHSMTIFGLPEPLPPAFAYVSEIENKAINHFNIFGGGEPKEMAEWHNRLQELAAGTRLGIPVTLSSDPRHAVSSKTGEIGPAIEAGGFSQWPEPIGLGATGDPEIVEQFADIARQEYLAVGIRVALHPMADLATEPRWSRVSGTFGEDAKLASAMVKAYIWGFQGAELGWASVACVTKHFPGGGAQKDGEDPHFPYGREQVYPAGKFEYHLLPFAAAIEAGTAQVMPYYGMPVGTDLEEVGFAFNKQIISGLLRQRFGFEGVVCTDWGVLTDDFIFGKELPARAWGVEHLTVAERAAKAIAAGVDQFGGEGCPEVIVDLVNRGVVREERIDLSARRLLRDKFRLGLFDQPFVDPERAGELVGNRSFAAAGLEAQRRSIVLLKNGNEGGAQALPLQRGARLYLENVDPPTAAGYGEVVSEIDDADVAVLRLAAPYEERKQFPLEDFLHAGSLEFPEAEKRRILNILERKASIVDIFLERPAVFPEIANRSAAVLGSFGASDQALLDILFGVRTPSGRLPFELPSSMEAVGRQAPDAPCDSGDPLFAMGHGLSYGTG
jgi:beta-glucosidase